MIQNEQKKNTEREKTSQHRPVFFSGFGRKYRVDMAVSSMRCRTHQINACVCDGAFFASLLSLSLLHPPKFYFLVCFASHFMRASLCICLVTPYEYVSMNGVVVARKMCFHLVWIGIQLNSNGFPLFLLPSLSLFLSCFAFIKCYFHIKSSPSYLLDLRVYNNKETRISHVIQQSLSPRLGGSLVIVSPAPDRFSIDVYCSWQERNKV